ETIPRSASGKVQRLRLAEALGANDGAPAAAAAYVAPATPVAAAIALLWRDVLGVARVGADDDFFVLGGDSLKAASFLARFEAACGVAIPVSAIFDAPTPAGLEGRLAREHPGIEDRLAAAAAGPATSARDRFEL
ncbi:MAG: hypothetical protein J0L91_05285, partial [Burkholderiales bacterium]|nr:hypothetical protein [Burkholderiales bacterium]